MVGSEALLVPLLQETDRVSEVVFTSIETAKKKRER
jgi:hypothetical protein